LKIRLDNFYYIDLYFYHKKKRANGSLFLLNNRKDY